MGSLTLGGIFNTLKPLPPDRRGDRFFGINAALSEEDWTGPAMAGSGAGLDRVQIRWDVVEPSPGDFRFDDLDRVVADGERWHLSILAVVDGAPAWAVDRPERVGPGPSRGLDTPAFLPNGEPNPANPWAVFLATVARRYRGHVVAWEIWNEPNLPESWRGTPADYALLLRAAGVVLRREAPGAPVVVAGMVEDDGRFLRQVLAALCPEHTCTGRPFDGVGWHVYNDPLGVLRVADATRAVLADYHLQADPWITEANVAVIDPQVAATELMPDPKVSPDQQAAFIIETYALARAVGARSVAVYRATDIAEADHFWGLIRADQSPRPSLLAYRTAATWFSRSTFVALTHPSPSTTRVVLRRVAKKDDTQGENRGSEEIDVLWSTGSAPTTLRIPARSVRGTLVDPTGRETSVLASGGAFAVRLAGAPTNRRPGCSPPGGMMSTPEEMKAELERLRAENEQLKATNRRGIYMKVSEKGALSLYGLSRFPVTLYPEQWVKILDLEPDIRRFIEDNKSQFKWKAPQES
jgi:hypothetical protein